MFIKADLDYSFIQVIKRINLYLENVLEKNFISQELPEAGLGCHPYHITLVGKVHNIFDDLNSINRYLEKYQSGCTDLMIEITNQIKITNKGTVIWYVESHGLRGLGYKIFEDLNYEFIFDDKILSNYTNSDYLHITLGICTNKDYYGKIINIKSDIFDRLYPEYSIVKIGCDY